MKNEVAIVTVSNDLTTDQRVHRTCLTLKKMAFEVRLVGRALPESQPLLPRTYHTTRLKLCFRKGPGFYAELNIRLFFYLLSHHSDLMVSNDLDTLPAVYLAFRFKSILKKFKFIKPQSKKQAQAIRHLHDCHEYFRGVPELVERKRVTAIWKSVEDRIFPKLRLVTAVNDSIAGLYKKEYNVPVTVLRNVPVRRADEPEKPDFLLKIINGRKVIIYQGAVNIGRGLEEAVSAMKYIKVDAILIIAGTGDIYKKIAYQIVSEGLQSKVFLAGQVPLEQLSGYTTLADIGISVEKDLGINYHYCLPNKFLDYIQAGIPVLVSPFTEMKKIVEQYGIGEFLISHEPEMIAKQLDEILANDEIRLSYQKNTLAAAKELCWEKEETKLVKLLNNRIIEQ